MDNNEIVSTVEEFNFNIQKAENRQRKCKIGGIVSFASVIASSIGICLTAVFLPPALPVFLALIPASFLGVYFSMVGERKAKLEISDLKQEKQSFEERSAKELKEANKATKIVRKKKSKNVVVSEEKTISAVEESLLQAQTDEISVN